MACQIWIPGSDQLLDNLFDDLREQQYQNRRDLLWSNYSRDAFQECTALSIFFDDQGKPELCSSILSRACWPKNAYRILNRTWKCYNRKRMMPEVSLAMGTTAQEHIRWLERNTDCRLYFMSRETNHWMSWSQKHFKRLFDLDLEISENKYLTCANESNDSCWQYIIYNGDETLLTNWKHR